MEIGGENLTKPLIKMHGRRKSHGQNLKFMNLLTHNSSSTSSEEPNPKSEQFHQHKDISKLYIGTLNIIIVASTVLILDFIFREDIFKYELQFITYFRNQSDNPGFYNFGRDIIWLTDLNTIKFL